MTDKSDRVKQVEALVNAGLAVPDALYQALGGPTAFAKRNGFEQPEVTMCFRAYHQRRYDDIRDAACRELEADRAWLDSLIDNQRSNGEPESARESA